jgi:hypothetical protein
MYRNANMPGQSKRYRWSVGAWLGLLWALPLDLAGMLLALPVVLRGGRMQRMRSKTPALLVYGPFADFLLAHHPFGAMSAMAIGHVVIAGHHGLTRQTLRHELMHVRQAAVWGVVFPFAYVASSLWASLRGRDAYWNNFFEVAARKAERTG